MQSQLIVDNISIAYGQQRVIKDCTFNLPRGRILSLLGASGCGKSTLLKGIAGLLPLHEGQILLNDKVISKPHYHSPPEQRGVGMIFQDYALFPHLTVAENVTFGLHKLPKAQRQKKCAQGLEVVRLSEFSHRYPHELSGGQQQRVAIARTLVCEPSMMLFDEPFSNLDVAVRQTLMQEIKQLLSDQQITAIFVTHDKNEAFAMADDIAIMHEGTIVQFGEPQYLYDNPTDQNIAEFLGTSTVLPASQNAAGWQTPAGLISPSLAHKVIIWPTDNHQQYEVYLRPHQVQLTPNIDGNACIEHHSFRGDLHVYHIRLQKTVIQLMTQQRFNVGEKIDFTIKLD